MKTTIGYGAPGVEGTSKAHGSPLGGPQTLAAMRARLDWPDTEFHVPTAVSDTALAAATQGGAARAVWEQMHADWKEANPGLAQHFPLDRVPEPATVDVLTQLSGEVAESTMATRKASGAALTALAEVYPPD